MSLDNVDARVINQVENETEFPGARTPRVLVDEAPPIPELVAVQRHAELNVLRRFSFSVLELPQPSWIFSMYVLPKACKRTS